MAEIAKKTKRYRSDLTDEEWERIAPVDAQACTAWPAPDSGLARDHQCRAPFGAHGLRWEMLLVHFGPWQTVYWWFRRLMRRFLFQTIHDLCLMCDRERAGREASPSAAVKSVKAPHARTRGYDAGKKIVGRKRHIAAGTPLSRPQQSCANFIRSNKVTLYTAAVNAPRRACEAQTRRTDNVVWHEEDVLEIHAHDAEERGIRDGDWVALASRAGETALRARLSDRVQPGVVYTTFHHPETGANVVTTEFSDWATNCPECKATAVQVRPTNRRSSWQNDYAAFSRQARRVATAAE